MRDCGLLFASFAHKNEKEAKQCPKEKPRQRHTLTHLMKLEKCWFVCFLDYLFFFKNEKDLEFSISNVSFNLLRGPKQELP